MHAIKKSDSGFSGFGVAYFSLVAVGVAKAWKKHARRTMNDIVPVGTVRFVFCVDGVQDFRIEDIGDDRYARITVPPGIWFGFQGKADPKSLVLNWAQSEVVLWQTNCAGGISRRRQPVAANRFSHEWVGRQRRLPRTAAPGAGGDGSHLGGDAGGYLYRDDGKEAGMNRLLHAMRWEVLIQFRKNIFYAALVVEIL